MLSRESLPVGGEDEHERQGGEDDLSSDKGDASRLMSQGGGDESTISVEGENAVVFPDPPAGSVPVLVVPPVEIPAQSTSSQASVTSVSEAKLEHLSLLEWKRQPGFQDFQFIFGQVFNPAITTGEKDLSAPIHDAVRASFRSPFRPVNPAHQYPAWRTERLVTRMVGVDKTHRISKVYRDRLLKEIQDVAKKAGLTQVEAHATSILRNNAGPDRPNMVCSADFSADKEVWTYVEEHQKDNQLLAIAQLAWYLLLANDAVGCPLGSILVGNKLQRVVIVGKTFFIETTEQATNGEPISNFEELFTRINECPMPFSLFDKVETGGIAAEPNNAGLQAFLKITGRASELAAAIGIDGLRRVPSAKLTILAECLPEVHSDLDLTSGDSALESITPRNRAFIDASKRVKTKLNSDQPFKPNEKKRKEPEDDAEDGDRQYSPSHGLSRAAPATRSSQRDRTRVDDGESSEFASNIDSSSELLSSWNLARLSSASSDWPISRFLQQLEEASTEYAESENSSITSKDEDWQLGPGDSTSHSSASSGTSTRWSDQFRDQKAILPSRVAGVLRAMGYKLALVTTDQLDRLIESTTEPT